MIILFVTSGSSHAGASSVTQEFSSFVQCKVVADDVAKPVYKGGNKVISIGCYKK